MLLSAMRLGSRRALARAEADSKVVAAVAMVLRECAAAAVLEALQGGRHATAKAGQEGPERGADQRASLAVARALG
ncbi:hypothetical protein PHYSODRAFT_342840 [Phytophthora sojae]|uniref:Uncharacterized protein n=1 Tax=Phytophthora sojae (strain P6497) TaxID=1094619 RepID=G5AHS9_PHYSP|nr:hypothetical protein PHYSODRAFT_342840 [Phytophthora sojae]EGZ04890.1 hypothetical protein PHYSODRAFT_342840 [Phytophthora sojae]|eukprot:XP_009539630.1 hypothetical protein PHYSODRAFT_342840 [Phytophthora sojae]